MHFNSRLDIPVAAARQSDAMRPRRDSAAICRERAAADLLASAAMINANQRFRLETSAASWTARAAILQRVEDGFARRTADAAAAELAGDPPADHASKL